MQRRSARFTSNDDKSTASIESIDRIEREIRRRNRTESVVEELEEPEERTNMDGNQFGGFLCEMQEANAQLATALARRVEGGREAEEGEEGEQHVFSLKPYGRVLDTTTKRGSELYNQAIKSFESKYDGSENTFHNFMSKVKQRAGHLMCGRIFNVEENGKTYNLFEDYSSITTEMAKGAAMNRWRMTGINRGHIYWAWPCLIHWRTNFVHDS